MKKLDIKLYKITIREGKESLVDEWLSFLNENSKEALKTLKNERVYLESYFKSIEDERLFVYLFMGADDIEKANSIAGESTSDLDKKHFEYMSECVDYSQSIVLDSYCYMNNLEDYEK